jgi:hypothetical protein
MRKLFMVALTLGLLALPYSLWAQERAGKPDHEILGLTTHPYVEFNSDRVSGHDAQWTNGVSAGVELDFGTPWLGLGYTLHDILSERQTVPWDGTAFAKLGLYQGGIGSLGSVPTFVHAAVVLAVPTGPDKLSLGVEAGFEFDVDPIYAGLRYTLRDTWVGDDDEVYPWDGEFGVAVGLYW